jgi:hypothetical protein
MKTHGSTRTIFFFVTLAFLAASAALAASTSEPTQLLGWELTAPSSDRFEASRDQSVTFDGKPTARLQTSVERADLGSLVFSIDAEKYRGKRIRFATNAKTKGVEGGTGSWLRIDSPSTPFRAYVDTHDVQLKDDKDWTPLTIVIDVPEDGQTVYLGLSQEGAGTSWFGPVSVETVDPNVPVSYRVGSRNFANAPLACSKAPPTGSHIQRHVCYNFRTGRSSYLALPKYIRGAPLSGTRVKNPRGWLWIWG